MIISSYVLFNIYKNLKDTVQIVLQSVPEGIDIESLRIYFVEFIEVLSVHDLHVWSMDGEYNVLSAHIVVGKDLKFERMEEIKNEVRSHLLKNNIQHSTLEFENDDSHEGIKKTSNIR